MHGPAAAVVTLAIAAIAPAGAAAATSCGTAKGVGNGIVVTSVKTTSGSCPAAKSVAKAFARTRIAPDGYTCKEKFSAATRAKVTCRGETRTVTFKVAWTRVMPLPPAVALPNANGS